jgi:hypothetical protein
MRLEELQGMSVTTEQMNDLQTNGLISDLAVTWSDVAECDRPAALAWIGGKAERLAVSSTADLQNSQNAPETILGRKTT